MAVLIIGQLAGGLFMVSLPNEQGALKFDLFQWHKSFGLTILILSVLRVLWRIGHRPPSLPDEMPGYEKAAARATHILFYGLILTIPVVGWAVVSASPFANSVPTYLFGSIAWPHMPFFEAVADRSEITQQLSRVHKYLGFLMIGLMVLHIGAALKHHLINRDDILSRMLPIVRR